VVFIKFRVLCGIQKTIFRIKIPTFFRPPPPPQIVKSLLKLEVYRKMMSEIQSTIFFSDD